MVTEGRASLARLGAWAGRRAEPRLWISLAGAGCALAVAGVVIISGDAQVGEEGFSDGSRVPGIILCLVVAAGGYALLHWFPESPAATAGVTAIALAVPPFFYFLTFDADGTPPWSAEGILALSALVWLVSYVLGPAWVVRCCWAPDWWRWCCWRSSSRRSRSPPGSRRPSSTRARSPPTIRSPGTTSSPARATSPDLTTLGIISLVFGAAYLVAAHLLDRRGFAGTATRSSRRPSRPYLPGSPSSARTSRRRAPARQRSSRACWWHGSVFAAAGGRRRSSAPAGWHSASS